MGTQQQQVDLEHYTGKQTNAGIVAKLNEMIDFMKVGHGMMSDLTNHVNELKTALEKNQQELTESKDKLKIAENRIGDLQMQVTGLSVKCDRLSNANIKLQDQLTSMESQSRRNNLILDGLADSEHKTPDQCRDKVMHVLEVKMEVANVRDFRFVRIHRLGRYQKNSKKPRPVIFKLHYYDEREKIWQNRRKLQGHNIWLQEDFPEAIRQKGSVLAPVVKAAKAQGKKAFLSVDRAIIDDQVYTTKSLHRLPSNLQPANLAQRVDTERKYTAFFSPGTPLSNFYPANITDDNGLPFKSCEQMYQYNKAQEFHDDDTADRILSASTPYESYKLGQNIKGFDQDKWSRVAKNTCSMHVMPSSNKTLY